MGCTPSRHSSSQQGVNHNQASESSICASEQASQGWQGETNVVRPTVAISFDQESLCRLKGNLFFTETSKEQQSHDQVDQVHCLFIHVNAIDICLFKRFVIWCMLIRAISYVYDSACSNIIIAICHVRTTERLLNH